ncbi:MAG: hypothetical protein ACRDJG_02260 [Actinomycetota bacterium]
MLETMVGFALGYYVGTQQGREGLVKALSALKSISKSEEFTGLTTNLLAMGSGLVKAGLSKGGGVVLGGLAGAVADRAKGALGGGLRRVV